MQNVRLDYQGSDLTFAKASMLAKSEAMNHHMHNPAIIAWHQHSTHAMSPQMDGANPSTWWEKYGEGNGGNMEITVGDEFDFVLMETEGFETVDQLPVRNLIDASGQEYICLTTLLGADGKPVEKACIPIDEWAANQY